MAERGGVWGDAPQWLVVVPPGHEFSTISLDIGDFRRPTCSPEPTVPFIYGFQAIWQMQFLLSRYGP